MTGPHASEQKIQVYTEALDASIQQLLRDPEPMCVLAGEIASLEPRQLKPSSSPLRRRHMYDSTVWRPDPQQSHGTGEEISDSYDTVVRHMTVGRQVGDLAIDVTLSGVRAGTATSGTQWIELKLISVPGRLPRLFHPEDSHMLGNDLPDSASEVMMSRAFVAAIMSGKLVPSGSAES